ncbi:MAG: hypothetical protein R6U25_11015 [Alkalispirochaeta sp.]
MRKFALMLGALMLTVSMVTVAQSVNDDFGSMREWTAGPGDWVVRGGRLVQQDAGEPLARADREVSQSGEYELEFTIRYVDGGYRNQDDFEDGIYHAGFGIHLGVENPALGRSSWGAGESYLLWLNLDTRPETRRDHPEHYGFRAQVYQSNSNTSMGLVRDAALERDPELSSVVVDDYMSIDLVAALRAWGVDLSVDDLARYLDQDIPVNIRVNTRTGRIGVLDPTAPVRFYFNVDPEVLQGDYVSLRTNGLAASYNYFQVD